MPENNNLLSQGCISSYPDSIFSNYLQIRSRHKSERFNLTTMGISTWCSKLIIFLFYFKTSIRRIVHFGRTGTTLQNMVHCNGLFLMNWEENVRTIISNVCASECLWQWPLDRRALCRLGLKLLVTLLNKYNVQCLRARCTCSWCLTPTDVRNSNSHLWAKLLATNKKNHFLQEHTPTQRLCHAIKFPFKCNFWLWEGIPKQA